MWAFLPAASHLHTSEIDPRLIYAVGSVPQPPKHLYYVKYSLGLYILLHMCRAASQNTSATSNRIRTFAIRALNHAVSVICRGGFARAARDGATGRRLSKILCSLVF